MPLLATFEVCGNFCGNFRRFCGNFYRFLGGFEVSEPAAGNLFRPISTLQPGVARAGTPVLCGSQGLRERRQPPAVVAWVVVSMEYVYRLSSGSLGNAVGISHGRVRSMEWDGAPLRRRRHPQIRRSEPTRRSPQQGLEFGPKRP